MPLEGGFVNNSAPATLRAKWQTAAGDKRFDMAKTKGARNRVSVEIKARLSERAREYSDEALEALVHVCRHGDTHTARVAAANALLDRGYGKPMQSMEHSGPNGGPIQSEVLTKDQRDAAAAAALRSVREETAE